MREAALQKALSASFITSGFMFKFRVSKPVEIELELLLGYAAKIDKYTR